MRIRSSLIKLSGLVKSVTKRVTGCCKNDKKLLYLHYRTKKPFSKYENMRLCLCITKLISKYILLLFCKVRVRYQMVNNREEVFINVNFVIKLRYRAVIACKNKNILIKKLYFLLLVLQLRLIQWKHAMTSLQGMAGIQALSYI